jgi:hypothetical protein
MSDIIEPQEVSTEPVQIICILDRSGSMGPLTSDVIGSYNTFIEKQQKEPGEAEVTLVLFDTEYEVVYDKIDVKNVPELTKEVYFARGGTALLDAIGKAVSTCTAKDVMVLIQTDGEENSSCEYTKDMIKKLIDKKETIGWDFIFLGANIDAISAGDSFGMKGGKSVQYIANSDGMKVAFDTMSNATSSYRSSKMDNISNLVANS